MPRNQNRYYVEAWDGATCVGFTTTYQCRTTVAAVTHYIADLNAARVFVVRYQREPWAETIAQVSRAGHWQWQGPVAQHRALREYVETER